MVDNVAVTAGSGTSIATDDVGGAHYQRVKISNGEADSSTHLGVYAEDEAHTDGDTGLLMLVKRSDTPAATSGTDGDYEPLQVSGGFLWVRAVQKFATVSTDVTRAADTVTYAINDTYNDSSSAPTANGFTFTSAARVSGGSGIITDAIVSNSNDPATPMQGEVWIFDTNVTHPNDNVAFVVSDTEIKTLVGVIPFVLTDSGNNDSAWISNLNMGFTTVGSANLKFMVRLKNAYVPASAEVLTVRLKIIQLD